MSYLEKQIRAPYQILYEERSLRFTAQVLSDKFNMPVTLKGSAAWDLSSDSRRDADQLFQDSSCHCREVTFTVESNTPAPYQLCQCSICRKVGGYMGSVNISQLGVEAACRTFWTDAIER